MANPVFEMSLSLNVLNHLGINLYSNHPAVLSETVANAWDADASNVSISLDLEKERIIVQDDGIGMTADDINTRFLRVGYRRRASATTATTPSGRAVMGRKGIGKLALFSVAQTILVETIRDGEKSALLLELEEINRRIGGDDPGTAKPYFPKVMPVDSIDFQQGTRITLTDLKKSISKTAPHLRRRLARRFSVIGGNHNFTVTIGGQPLTVSDRDISSKSQYIWIYGTPEQQNTIGAAIHHNPRIEKRKSALDENMVISGWIGTAYDTTSLRDASGEEHLNRIPLMIRGKLAQEDILDGFRKLSSCVESLGV